MAPNSSSGVIFAETTASDHVTVPPAKKRYDSSIVWRNVILFAYLHAAALYGVYLVFVSAKAYTSIAAYCLYVLGGLGITAGAHRLWSHKSYKAKMPLQIILMLFNTLAFQNSIHEWSRDHRVHHKFSETDADPHNATRGMFFSHMGWLLVKKHPDVMTKGKTVDVSDLDRDPIVAFQKKYYLILMPLICFILPTIAPVYFWGETWSNAWFITLLRYTYTLHITWFVNSFAHFYGAKPFDKFINPSQNLFVSICALGEGWHNYHHTFPWDYKTSELGHYSTNVTTLFIDFCAKIGWAYELKSVSAEMIAKRAARTGDGSYIVPERISPHHAPPLPPHELNIDGGVWGWDDEDMPAEDKVDATVINPIENLHEL